MSRFVFIILLAAQFSQNSYAQEAEPAPAPVAASPAEIGSTQQEVLDLQARLLGLKTKISAKKDILKKLIGEKQSIKDEKKSIEIFNEMKSEYKEMQASIKEYDEQISLLNYRYPEKGLKNERQYERIETKTLIELENEFSLEGKIKKTISRVRQQFPEKNINLKKTKPAKSTVNSSPTINLKDPSRSSVTEPQLLSK